MYVLPSSIKWIRQTNLWEVQNLSVFLVKNNYKQKKMLFCVYQYYISRIHMYISQYHNSFYRRYETINFIRKSFINSGLKTHKGKKVKYQHRLIFYYLKNSWLTFKDTSIYESFSSWRCSYSFNLSQIHNLHYQSSL